MGARSIARSSCLGEPRSHRYLSSRIPDDLQDFFYVCPSHLKDRGFCSPIVDQAAVEAKKKKEMEEEVERVKKEYEEKQKKKKEKEKEKEKSKDKDKDGKNDEDKKDDLKEDDKVRLEYLVMHRCFN